MGVTQVPVSAEFQAGQPLWQVTVETQAQHLAMTSDLAHQLWTQSPTPCFELRLETQDSVGLGVTPTARGTQSRTRAAAIHQY